MTEISEKTPQLDVKWYPRFEESGSFQAYEYLDGDKAYREEQKRRFLSGEVENPRLDYPRLESKNLREREEKLLELKENILARGENEIVKQTYRWKINEKVAELRMLQAAVNGDMKRFKRYSEFIYGKPSREIFAYTINSLRSKISQQKDSENQDLRQAARELDAILPKGVEKVEFISLPTEETVQLAREEALKRLGDLVNIPEIEETINAEGIRASMAQALQSEQIDEFQVVIDKSSKTAISVDQEEKLIKIPESRELLSSELKKKIAHEIGTHVFRRIKGERSKLMLLGLGLDRYERGEEGIATMREQTIEGKIEDFTGLERHLAISLAYGLDGTPRDFRGVYEIMEKYYLFKKLEEGENSIEAKQEARRLTWNTCVRTFRGTDCSTSGVCFTKDIIYREGNIGIWEVISKKPDEMRRFIVGKYDPANPRHILILEQLGITEGALSSLK